MDRQWLSSYFHNLLLVPHLPPNPCFHLIICFQLMVTCALELRQLPTYFRHLQICLYLGISYEWSHTDCGILHTASLAWFYISNAHLGFATCQLCRLSIAEWASILWIQHASSLLHQVTCIWNALTVINIQSQDFVSVFIEIFG